MKRNKIKIALGGLMLALALGAVGCVIPEPQVGVTVSAPMPPAVSVSVETPSLALVSDGVYVIQDSTVPMFYSDNFYWRFWNGNWYRSTYYGGGWAYVGARAVPYRMRGIRNPNRYVRYRAPAGSRVWRGPARGQRGIRPYRGVRPGVRHPGHRPGMVRPHRPGVRHPGHRPGVVRPNRPGVRPGVHHRPHVRPGARPRPRPSVRGVQPRRKTAPPPRTRRRGDKN